LTHCAGYRAAAVAHSRDLRALGIDAEPHQPLPAGVLKIIALKQEQAGLSELAAADDATCWDRILFCAKETVYKAWFPLTRCWLGFDDAAVTINPGTTDPAQGSFSADILVAAPTVTRGNPTHFDGRWLHTDELVIATVAVS
jgi:4'-phosphopantetheinyl transferase EntD